MTLQFIPESEAEFLDSIEYYEDIESGLGMRFRDEVLTEFEWIQQHSEKPRLRAGGYRRVNLKIFPFYIIYITRDPDFIHRCNSSCAEETRILEEQETEIANNSVEATPKRRCLTDTRQK